MKATLTSNIDVPRGVIFQRGWAWEFCEPQCGAKSAPPKRELRLREQPRVPSIDQIPGVRLKRKRIMARLTSEQVATAMKTTMHGATGDTANRSIPNEMLQT